MSYIVHKQEKKVPTVTQHWNLFPEFFFRFCTIFFSLCLLFTTILRLFTQHGFVWFCEKIDHLPGISDAYELASSACIFQTLIISNQIPFAYHIFVVARINKHLCNCGMCFLFFGLYNLKRTRLDFLHNLVGWMRWFIIVIIMLWMDGI